MNPALGKPFETVASFALIATTLPLGRA